VPIGDRTFFDAKHQEFRMIDTVVPGNPQWLSNVEAAECLDDASAVKWDVEADFVVVGYGGAGTAAALQAAEDGLKVIAVDAFEGGGATALNGGIFYAGGGTSVQRQAGVEDSVDEMYKYLRIETQGVVSDETLRRFCEGSVESIDWLVQHGVKFDGSRVFPRKIFYPPAGFFLYYSDSSLTAAYRSKARPAARGHKYWHPPSNQATGFGIHMTRPLQQSAEGRGVQVMRQTEARQLVTSSSGEVLGVVVVRIPPELPEARLHREAQEKARAMQLKLPSSMPGFARLDRRAQHWWKIAEDLQRQHGQRLRIRAHRGVCLAAGGFIWNRPMVAAYAPRYTSNMAMGSPGGDNGSGIRLGQTAGGAATLMERMSSWRFINPPSAWPKGILVNARGARFVNEELYGAAIGRAMNEDNEGIGYIILDRTLYRRSWRETLLENLFPFMRIPLALALLFQTRKARTLEALAKKMGFDPTIFRGTVEDYNRGAEAGQDAYGKDPAECHALREGPYYAVDVSVASGMFPCTAMSVGGLKVDERSGEVLRADGSTIRGLYAAGRTAIGLCSNTYVSGLSAADCVFSGRRAARHASGRRAVIDAGIATESAPQRASV